MLRLLRTSSFRLTVAYALLFAASVVILFGVTYVEMTRAATQQQDELLESEIKKIQRAAKRVTDGDIAALVEEQARHPPGLSIRYRLLDASGAVLAGNLPPTPDTDGAFWFKGPRADKPQKNGRIRARAATVGEGLTLIVAQDREAQEELDELREVVARDFGLAIVLTILLAIGGGALLSAGVLRRVASINKSTREIVDHSLSRRLPVGSAGDEFDRLAESVNGMLARIESQMAAMRQVSADIAHDLRTPLTRLRSGLESAQNEADPERVRVAVTRALSEVDGVLSTFSALLRIAQIEAASSAPSSGPFDLTEVLGTLVEVYEPDLEAKAQTLTSRIEPDLAIAGDRDLIAQLFANLLQNASHHSPQGARIELLARRADTHIEVVVADDGPGIPAEEREKVFRRLYRLERSRTTPGSGLGLALVAAVAGMHQITLSLEDNQPGLRVIVRVPSPA